MDYYEFIDELKYKEWFIHYRLDFDYNGMDFVKFVDEFLDAFFVKCMKSGLTCNDFCTVNFDSVVKEYVKKGVRNEKN